ncbi:hypothetical protein AX15_001522 [Amanita polypyramis BW_CC]|nr:hypothetical protein AX15_001522 [Amanita polypyramis BW_CC]
MFTTARPAAMPTIPSARPAPTQTAQKKYYADGASFRVFRAPVMSSFPYTAAPKSDSDYYSTRPDNRHWHNSSYRDANGGRPPIADDRARTPRFFSESEHGLDNRKPATEYFTSSHFPSDDVIYDPRISDIYPPDYDDYYAVNTTPTSTYSLIVSEDTSISMSDPADLSSDYSRPTTPVDSGISAPQHNSQSSGFRSRVDSGYTTSHISTSEPDPSFRSGSNDNSRFATDSRRHPAFHQTRPGNVTPAVATDGSSTGTGGGSNTTAEPHYAESVLSIESEDEVHRVAKLNAGYNAASSAYYGALGRESEPILVNQEYGTGAPGVVPSASRVAMPIATPHQSDNRQAYTDGPLTTSPSQIQYADELHRSASYRDNGLRRSPDGKDNNSSGISVYSPGSSYRTNGPWMTVPPRYADDFLPPLKEWDESRVPPTPGNSPQSPFVFQGEQNSPPSRSRRPGERDSDTAYSRPLPIPPRLYSSSDPGSHSEKVVATHYVPRSPEGITKREMVADDRRRERGGSISAQVEPSRSQTTTAGLGPAHYSSDEYDTAGVKRSTSSRRSKEGQRSTAAEDIKRTSSLSPPHDHEPRLIPKMDGSALPTADRRQVPPRRNSVSVAPVEESRSRSGRSSRDVVDSGTNDREGSGRSKKSSSGYDRPDRNGSSREERTTEKTKSSRHGHTQDRMPYPPTSQRQEHTSSRAPVQTPTSAEKHFEFDRRRKDSMTQPISASEIPVIISPSLVPLARPTASQSEQVPRSYSRGAPAATVSVESHATNNNSYTTRRERDAGSGSTPTSREYASYTPRPPSAAPEPHRRYSDGDVPQAPPFLPVDASGRPLPQSALYARRCVRWNDNLICPSPVLPSQRREGWFNRRGDQLWTNDGIYMPVPAGQEYPPDLDDYPEYGEGWMSEKGVRIDMGHRLIPKTPLRPALKQTPARS